MRRVATLVALVALWSGSTTLLPAADQTSAAPAKVVTLQKLKDNLYLATGGGGNSAIFVTDLGVVIVDTKLAGWGKPLLDKIRTITDKPVTTIINTHAHADHVGSNEFFGTAVEIVAHENTRLTMDKLDAFKGEKVNFLPKLMFRDKMTLSAGRDRIDLYYFGAGHTGGDAWVVFPAARVMHAGDLFARAEPPVIDTAMGGSGLEYPDTLAKAADGIKNVDTIITGHGPVVAWKDLRTYANFTRDFRDVVVDGFNHGLGASEIAARWSLPAKYAGYAAPPERVKADVEAIVGELSK
ncbi:MAG TPA: MBL fold metallo-hydrolase [Vicinamibacterales bacterium]|nr:MBL fold metallo-hydrolase [Vicinamibacterales bacterium]